MALAITESKSGREAWAADVFVDATGDGDLAALAGCGFDYGREGTGETQPMSLMAILAGIRAAEVDPFICGERHGDRPPKDRFLAEMARAGVAPSYGSPTRRSTYAAARKKTSCCRRRRACLQRRAWRSARCCATDASWTR